MHMQCCDIMYDVTAPFKDIMSANKMMRFQSTPTTKLPKMAMDRQEHHGNGTPGGPGVPCDATYMSPLLVPQ